MADSEDEARRAYASLAAFKSNLPQPPHYEFEERYVRDYHALLDRISPLIGRDLREFRIGDEELYRLISSRNSVTGEVTYRGDKQWVRRERFLMKFDAALNYITLLMPEEPKRRMGF